MSKTGSNRPFRDDRSCPSIASECQQMAETSSFLSSRRRYLFPLYFTLSSSLANCLKRSKLIIGPLCLLLKIVYRQARKKMFSRSSGGQLSRPKSDCGDCIHCSHCNAEIKSLTHLINELQGHLLSCPGQLKTSAKNKRVSGPTVAK